MVVRVCLVSCNPPWCNRNLTSPPSFFYFFQAFSADEAHGLVRVLLRVSLHHALMRIYRDISRCIGALVDAVPDSRWMAWRSAVAEELPTLSAHHHDLLFLLQMLPLTKRCRELAESGAQWAVKSVMALRKTPSAGLDPVRFGRHALARARRPSHARSAAAGLRAAALAP